MKYRFDNLEILRKFAIQFKRWGQIACEDIKEDIGLQVFMIWAILTVLVISGCSIYEFNKFERNLEKLDQSIDKLIEQKQSNASLPNNTVIAWYSAQNSSKIRQQ